MPLQLPPWPPCWPEIDAAVGASLRCGDWGRYQSQASGELGERLAQRFAVPPAVGSSPAIESSAKEIKPHVRLCCSGTAAMELALRAARIGPGDEVILAAFDYPGNFRSVELLGATPVLVDVAPDRVTLDPESLDAAASKRVRAVIASHLFGQPAPVDTIAKLCEQHGWIFIEDACQVPGMEIDSRPAGSFGHLATLSFGGSKLLTAGNGGALLSWEDRLSARLGPWIDRPSDAFPLSPLQASVLLPQLDRLASWNRRRAETARWLADRWPESFPAWQLFHPSSSGPGSPAEASTVPQLTATADYKLAWLAPTSAQRDRIVQAAAERTLPIGAGFRSTDRTHSRRCRKPVPLAHSAQLGQRLCTLDHTALMIEPDQRTELLDELEQVYRATCTR